MYQTDCVCLTCSGAALTAWRTNASSACRSTAGVTLCSWPSPPASSKSRCHAANGTASAKSTSAFSGLEPFATLSVALVHINPSCASLSGPVSPPGTRTAAGCQRAPVKKSHLTQSKRLILSPVIIDHACQAMMSVYPASLTRSSAA